MLTVTVINVGAEAHKRFCDDQGCQPDDFRFVIYREIRGFHYMLIY